jgi:hypothetical protein
MLNKALEMVILMKRRIGVLVAELRLELPEL